MAKNKNSNKGLILGTVLSSLAGAAYALWKTPMSGQELRNKLSAGQVNPSKDAPAAEPKSTGGGITNKVMSVVERTLAPIVGVDLGKTANNGGNATDTAPINVADTPSDVAPPTQVQTATSAAGTPIADPEAQEALVPTGSDTIRMKKFAWGTPAPEAEKAETPVQGEVNAPVEQPTSVNEPKATPAPAATSAQGQEGIRSQRYDWGDPKPDAADATRETPVAGNDPAPTQRTQQVAPHEPAATGTVGDSEVAGNVADTVMASSASVSTGKMVPFPKLGGLEDKS